MKEALRGDANTARWL